MKTLRSILPEDYISTIGDMDIEISGIAFDSRKLCKGNLFVAVPGTHVDGNVFIFDAIERGAAAVVSQSNRKNIEVPVVKVENAREALSDISRKFYDDPSAKIQVIGITGTKGKTTVTYLVQSILKHAYHQAFRIGTVEYDMGHTLMVAANTTPESQILQSLFADAIKHGIEHGIMEVSSHALKCYRVRDLSFAVAGFTNLSLEHTEFHPDMEDYYNAKRRLFLDTRDRNKPCVIGIDDDYGRRLAEDCIKAGKKVFTVSVDNPDADFYSANAQMTGTGNTFDLCHKGERHKCQIKLAGKFNIFNAIMSAALCKVTGVDFDHICAGLKATKTVPGRFESIRNNHNINIIVDYAHSPAALEIVLQTVRQITPKRVFAVFGCGGNRSHEKRPIMGKIAFDNADVIIITSDNPRKEPPDAIIDEIMAGIPSDTQGKILIREPDRLEAIFKALRLAEQGDTVVIAGKGHETGQQFAEKTIPFDDREVAKSFFIKANEEENEA